MATLAHAPGGGFSFWQKMAGGTALFIVFGFGQFAARGFVDYAKAPAWLHLHGLVMLSWLALLVAQPSLIRAGNHALHRRLGWLGAGLAVLVCVVGSFAGLKTIEIAHVPPFFTPPFFLALTQVGIVTFGGLVIAAIVRRRDQRWHERLMAGSAILLMEPALGRVLPMPLIMPWGEIAVMIVQLGVIALIARHDRRVLGRIHPATTSLAAITVLSHLLVEVLGRTALAAQWAASLAAG